MSAQDELNLGNVFADETDANAVSVRSDQAWRAGR